MEGHDNPTHHHTSIHHDAVIKALIDCANACDSCATSCIGAPDAAPFARCIELTQDCAALCELAARLLIRDAEIARSLLLVCVEACKVTATECGVHYNAHCQVCATYCKACERASHALQEDSL